MKKRRNKHRVAVYSFCVFLLAGLALVYYTPPTRASFYTLYSTSCLGGWENTQAAQGQPDTTDGQFTIQNSARLLNNIQAQIYCGSFTGDILQSDTPQKIMVKFSWGAIYPDIVSNAEAQQAQESEEVLQEDLTQEVLGEQTIAEEEQQEITTVDEDEQREDIVVDEEVVAPHTEEQTVQEEGANIEKEQSSETIINDPQGEETVSLKDILIKTVFAQEQNGEEVVEVKNNNYGLLEVLYTLDGQDWTSLGFIEADRFDDTDFEIPIERASQWEDISKIQIGIQSVPVLDNNIPTIYLDSVWIEVEYLRDENVQPQEEVKEVVEEEEIGEEIDYYQSEEEFEKVAEDADILREVPEAKVLSTRMLDRIIYVDEQATHSCQAEFFEVIIKEREEIFTGVVLDLGQQEQDIDRVDEKGYTLEIGSLPTGIDIYFKNNGEYIYQVKEGEDVVDIKIVVEESAQSGSFNIPIIFTKKGSQAESATVCQFNVVNQ